MRVLQTDNKGAQTTSDGSLSNTNAPGHNGSNLEDKPNSISILQYLMAWQALEMAWGMASEIAKVLTMISIMTSIMLTTLTKFLRTVGRWTMPPVALMIAVTVGIAHIVTSL